VVGNLKVSSLILWKKLYLLRSFTVHPLVSLIIKVTEDKRRASVSVWASTSTQTSKMDAIRKKMQSLKGETDQLYSIIRNFEDETQEAVERANQASYYNQEVWFY
jgi:hypothetical protein